MVLISDDGFISDEDETILEARAVVQDQIKCRAVELLSETEELNRASEVKIASLSNLLAHQIVNACEDLRLRHENSYQSRIDKVLRCAHDLHDAICELRVAEDLRFLGRNERFLGDESGLDVSDIHLLCALYPRPENKAGRPQKVDLERKVKLVVRLWFAVTKKWPTKTVTDDGRPAHNLHVLLNEFLGAFSPQSFAKWVAEEQAEVAPRDARDKNSSHS